MSCGLRSVSSTAHAAHRTICPRSRAFFPASVPDRQASRAGWTRRSRCGSGRCGATACRCRPRSNRRAAPARPCSPRRHGPCRARSMNIEAMRSACWAGAMLAVVRQRAGLPQQRDALAASSRGRGSRGRATRCSSACASTAGSARVRPSIGRRRLDRAAQRVEAGEVEGRGAPLQHLHRIEIVALDLARPARRPADRPGR